MPLGENVRIRVTGYCKNRGRIAVRNKSLKKIRFNAISVFIENTELGNVIFDTGYDNRFKRIALKDFNAWIYSLVTPFVVFEDKEAPSVNYIFISHFHADHISGLSNDDHSKIVCSRKEYEALKDLSGIKALRKGFIPKLLPDNFLSRAIFIEDLPEVDTKLSIFEKAYKLGDILIISLPGHSICHFGFLHENLFYVGDAIWKKENYIDLIYPHPISRLIHHDFSTYLATIQRISTFKKENPHIQVVGCHE